MKVSKSSNIILETYHNNRRLIRFYLILAVLVSFIMLGVSTQGIAKAAMTEKSNLSASEEYVDPIAFGGAFTVGLDMIFGTVSETMGLSVDPSIVMSLAAIGSILDENGVTGNLLSNMDFGILDFWWARIVVFAWTLAAIVPTLFNIEMEEIDTKYLGPCLLVGCEILYLFENGTGMAVNAADGNAVATAVTGFAMAILEFFKIILMYICYISVRVLMFAVNSLLLIASKINPAMSMSFKGVKALMALGYVALKQAPGWVTLLISLPLILAGLILIRKTLIIVNYFKMIYLHPFLRKIFRRQYTELIAKKVPASVKSNFNMDSVKIVIPVFPLKTIKGKIKIEKRTQWWFVADDTGRYLFRKFLFKGPVKLNLDNDPALYGTLENDVKHVYIRRPGLLKGSFCELITLRNEKKKAFTNMCVRFVFSFEYKAVIDKIIEITDFVDYDKYVEELKREKEEQRKANLEAKKQYFQEKKDKLKETATDTTNAAKQKGQRLLDKLFGSEEALQEELIFNELNDEE